MKEAVLRRVACLNNEKDPWILLLKLDNLQLQRGVLLRNNRLTARLSSAPSINQLVLQIC